MTRVSDDYFQEDFGVKSQASGQLLEQASLYYAAPFWNMGALAQQYQTLHPIDLLANSNQYARLPDL
ncbi:LPS assembly protein LptD, partial [Acinetobacter baumannii]